MIEVAITQLNTNSLAAGGGGGWSIRPVPGLALPRIPLTVGRDDMETVDLRLDNFAGHYVGIIRRSIRPVHRHL